MNWFKFWSDYDELKEPGRFLVALFLMSPFYVGLVLIEKHYLAGVLGCLFAVLLTLYRVMYLARMKK